MPTRYLTVVVKDGHNAIAQYGHFDGYPSGKGKEILGILRQDTEQYIFGYDSLQCEWAYVVDYDKQVFEIYKGWNRSPLAPEERFYANGYQRDGFYPVRIVAQYSLKELPESAEMEDRKWTE